MPVFWEYSLITQKLTALQFNPVYHFQKLVCAKASETRSRKLFRQFTFTNNKNTRKNIQIAVRKKFIQAKIFIVEV